MAVSVLPGIQLARMQDHTVEDIARRAPGVTGRAQITIRGIGTNAVAPGSDPSSALYLDGVYLARPAMVLADFLDLDRVEVLRGPQGTLYGRNSLGGAINLVSKTPTSDKEASFRVSGGSDGTFRVDARVSGPIIPGRLMGSGAILRGVRTGTVRDLNHPDHPLGGEDVIGARGQVRVVLNPRTELRIDRG
jgi:iron complex outermembrane receptor protein